MTAILIAGTLLLPAPGATQTTANLSDSPAERRLREAIATVESGSTARVRAFIREAYAPEVLRLRNEDRLVQSYMRLYDRSHGFEIDSLRSTRTEAAALLRTKLTGSWEQLSIRVEPEPPHRLLGTATFSIEPPKHSLAQTGVSDAARAREIERVARTLSEADVFSGVVLVAKGDSVVYLGTFGDADQEQGLLSQPETRFQLASLTKVFTTVAIAKLAEQGKLSWTDHIGRFFPTFPSSAARTRVRIRHLVTHSSGLREFERIPESSRSMDEYVRAVALAQEDSLLYDPGTRSIYTNANFVLLGKIIELASGQPFHEYIRSDVLRPAGMGDTDFLALGAESEGIAVGYDKRYEEHGASFVTDRPPAQFTAYAKPYCCAYSTAGDLLRLASALRSGRILRPTTVELLFSPKPEAGNWGYGFDILDEQRGLIGHGGSWTGQSNSLDMFTRSGYTVVILSNYTDGRSPLRETIRAILP